MTVAELPLAELVAGPPIILVETEAWTHKPPQRMNFDNILHYEHHGISWLSFNQPYLPTNHDWDFWFRDLLSDPLRIPKGGVPGPEDLPR